MRRAIRPTRGDKAALDEHNDDTGRIALAWGRAGNKSPGLYSGVNQPCSAPGPLFQSPGHPSPLPGLCAHREETTSTVMQSEESV